MLANQENYVLGTHAVRKQINLAHTCPICMKKIKFGIETDVLEKQKKYPFTHVVIHGNPVHVLIAYIDKSMRVRGIEASESIEISRDGETFSQLLRNWSNPT